MPTIRSPVIVRTKKPATPKTPSPNWSAAPTHSLTGPLWRFSSAPCGQCPIPSSKSPQPRARSAAAELSRPIAVLEIALSRLPVFISEPKARCAKGLVCVEVRVLDRKIPVRIQNLEAALFFSLVGFLIGKELLDQQGTVEIVVGDCGVLEDDGDAVIPAAVRLGVISRPGHSHLHIAAHLHR